MIDPVSSSNSPHAGRSSATFKGLAGLTLLLLIAACAGGPPTGSASGSRSDSAAGALEARAVARWEYLIAGDLAKAYDFLSPGYRSTRPLENYTAGARAAALNWKSVKWVKSDCVSSDSCTAELILSYSVKMAGAGDAEGFRHLEEAWVQLDGVWYHVPSR
jgi:hypothetical protein